MMASLDDSVYEVALRWVNTPYRHQASKYSEGADCLGLLRGIWREVIGKEPQERPNYPIQWYGDTKAEYLLEGLEQYFHQVPVNFSQHGQILAFRLRKNMPVQHIAITAGRKNGIPQMIHSLYRKGVVVSPIDTNWAMRCIGQFKFY